ncbi:MAG: hypothetical protein JO265_14575 [Acidimicrobiia bacterium]|nr:hypothetical protein [Acidimicrobiia bacterium]
MPLTVATSELFERASRYVDRRRLLLGLSGAVAVALVAAIPGVLTSADTGRSVRTQAIAPTPSTTIAIAALPPLGIVSPVIGAPQGPGGPAGPGAPPATATATAPAAVLATTFTRPTTTVAPEAAPSSPTTAPPAGSPPTPTPTCRNSYDPACGPFSWNPAPAPNQPITGTVVASQQAPGAPVTFTVNAEDPDAAPLTVCNVDYGDGSPATHCDPKPAIDPSYCPKQYGPWTPPARTDGKLTNAMSDHTYAHPAVYHVVFEIRSAMDDCNNPYASIADLTADVTVT